MFDFFVWGRWEVHEEFNDSSMESRLVFKDPSFFYRRFLQLSEVILFELLSDTK